MAIKVKARERLLKFKKTDSGYYRYVMQPEIYNQLPAEKVLEEAAQHSGLSISVMRAAWMATGDVVKVWATEGHSVPLPGLGTMRFGLRASSVADVDDVSSSLITSRRVIFTPSVDIKNALKKTSINITCYDRNGEIVKQVLSTDDGNVEDPEGNQGTNTNPSQGGDNQGGGNTDPGNDNPDGIE